jgi:hypothetical protein
LPRASAAYQRAGHVQPSWIQRARLGRAYVVAKQWQDAARELDWCHEHRGEAAVFLTPSLKLLPQIAELRAQVASHL